MRINFTAIKTQNKIKMKKILISTYLFLGVYGHSQTNLLLNGNLDSWVNNKPQNWELYEGDPADLTEEKSGGNTISGSAAKFDVYNSTDKLNQIFNIIPGKSYTVSIWYKVEKEGNVGYGNRSYTARLWSKWVKGEIFGNENSRELRVDLPFDKAATDRPWQEYKTTVTAPLDADKFNYEIRVYPGAVIYFDDLSVVCNDCAMNTSELNIENKAVVYGQKGNFEIFGANVKEVNIYNLTAQKIAHFKGNKFHLPYLPQGIYIAEIIEVNGRRQNVKFNN